MTQIDPSGRALPHGVPVWDSTAKTFRDSFTGRTIEEEQAVEDANLARQMAVLKAAAARDAAEPGGYYGGWLNPANWCRGAYTGDANAPDSQYDAAIDGGGDAWAIWGLA